MDRRLKQDALIEDALKSQPLAPMPRSVTVEVMSRIQSADAKRPSLLTWSDFVLSVVISSCIVALWFTYANLPPILVVKLRIQGILLYQQFLVNAFHHLFFFFQFAEFIIQVLGFIRREGIAIG